MFLTALFRRVYVDVRSQDSDSGLAADLVQLGIGLRLAAAAFGAVLAL